MILTQDLFNINFYKKNPFHGSYKGMHYRIAKFEPENGDVQLQVTVWPGPYNYETTPDDRKITAEYPFSNEGLAQICEYLNDHHAANY